MNKEREMFGITYFDEEELSIKEHYELNKKIRDEILQVLNKYNIKFVLAETDCCNKAPTNWKALKEWLEDNWKSSQDIWFVKIITRMNELEGDK